MAGTSKLQRFFVTTTAGEDETSEGNPENSKRDAVDVAPSVPAPEDEAAEEPATAEPARRGPVVQESDLALDNGSRSLSTGQIINQTENDNYSSRSMPPKRTVCSNIRISLKDTTMHSLGQWK